MKHARASILVGLALAVALPCSRAGRVAAATETDVVAKHGAVVSVALEASETGVKILERGGNAVDAAVATALALAVTYPQAGNLGGGGFMMVHHARLGQTACVEYRETAPGAATPELFKQLTPTSRGMLSAGVPGTVRGLALAHARFGRLPWKELVEPSVRLAEDGFVLDAHQARALNGFVQHARDYAEAVRVFSKPDGSAWETGDRFVQKDLAATLRVIGDQGPDAFYTGTIADKIVAEMQAGGGLITRGDLAAYQANIRQPIHGSYRGWDVFAPPPPSSGGVALVEMLNMLESFDLAAQGRTSAAATHTLIEVMRRAYFDRAMALGDPAYTAVPVARLTSQAYARQEAETIAPDHATPSAELGSALLAAAEGENTTHFSVVDAEGNAVSNTYTLQDIYGSYVVVRGAGFLLNNEMTDFNLHPGRTDRSGEIGTAPNVVEPGKRMLSSQTPTLVLRDGKVRLVTGSPGGRTIINTVLNMVLNVTEFGMTVRDAVDAPRMHQQWFPDVTRIEAGRVSDTTRTELEALGHHFEVAPRLGDAHSIWIDPQTGLRHGAADRRIRGSAAGY